jgi:TRAP-type transport system periplasmic protein
VSGINQNKGGLLMKKCLIGIGMVGILLIGMLAACQTPTQPAAPAQPGAPAATTAAPAKLIELTMNDHNPPQSGPAAANRYWAEQVSAQSNGKLKLTPLSGAALFSGAEAFRAVQTKAVPIAMYAMDAREGFQLNLVTALPFLGWKNPHFEKAYMGLLDKFPEMKKEWGGVEILGVFMMPGTNVSNAKKTVKVPADLKGMKIQGAEQMLNAVMQTAGATPVQLDITEMTTSINSKLIDGIMNHFNVMMIFGALQLMQYHTIFGNGINSTPTFIIGNTEVINGLPADVQKLIRGNSDTWTKKFIELSDGESAAARKIVDSKTATVLTPDEIKVWYDLVKQPIHDKWIADGKAKGLPAQAVYDEVLKLASQP